MIKNILLSEKKMMAIIVMNAIIIFFLHFPSCKHNPVLNVLDIVFLLIFTLEAIVKMREYGTRGYFNDKWNRFDFALVVLTLPSLVSGLFPTMEINIILLLRLFRLFRLLKFVKFVPHINMLLQGLRRAIRASVLVLMTLFCLDFMLALFSCHFYGNIAPQYFGNPLIASYTIFQLFTIEGWNEIPAVIGQQMADDGGGDVIIGFTKFFFVIIVLIGGIFGMSLANAIFVDEMTVDNNMELEKKIDTLQAQIEELKELITMNSEQ